MRNNTQKHIALVIEDEPIISRICKRVLMTKGYDVEIATSGLVAKEILQNKSYDIILSDIKTPGMNGMELYRHLEKTRPTLTQKVIFSTGDVLSGNIGEFLREVKRPYLAKPFTVDELLAVIESVEVEISKQL
jgi:CheY-like chemotaxis protein